MMLSPFVNLPIASVLVSLLHIVFQILRFRDLKPAESRVSKWEHWLTCLLSTTWLGFGIATVVLTWREPSIVIHAVDILLCLLMTNIGLMRVRTLSSLSPQSSNTTQLLRTRRQLQLLLDRQIGSSCRSLLLIISLFVNITIFIPVTAVSKGLRAPKAFVPAVGLVTADACLNVLFWGLIGYLDVKARKNTGLKGQLRGISVYLAGGLFYVLSATVALIVGVVFKSMARITLEVRRRRSIIVRG